MTQRRRSANLWPAKIASNLAAFEAHTFIGITTLAETSNEARSRFGAPDWIAIAGLALTVAGGTFGPAARASSACKQRTEDNTRRISVLEANDQKRGDQLTEITTVAIAHRCERRILLAKKDLKP
jgi:hypothetical protein